MQEGFTPLFSCLPYSKLFIVEMRKAWVDGS